MESPEMERKMRWCKRCGEMTYHRRKPMMAHQLPWILLWLPALPVLWLLNPWRCEACQAWGD